MKKKITLPNFLVVGVAKAGTTTIYDFFKKHPDVFVPDKKELNYFSIEYNKYDIYSYSNYFKKSSNYQLRGEVSPSYFWVNGTAKRIHNALGKIKIIVILRDPVERFISDLRYSQNFGYNLDFSISDINKYNIESAKNCQSYSWHDPVVLLKKGLYSTFLEEYFQFFPPNNIHIINFERMTRNYDSVIIELQDFLEIKSIKKYHIKSNAGGVPRSKILVKLLNKSVLLKRISKLILGAERANNIKQYVLRKNIKKSKKPRTIDISSLKKFYNQEKKYLNNFYRIDTKNWK